MPATTEAAEIARYAPSIHNSQPWRWRVGDTSLDLYRDHRRRLGVTDPDARLATVSCGAALHHARIALAARGLDAQVARLPDPTDPDHLAHVEVVGHIPVVPQAGHPGTLPLGAEHDKGATFAILYGDQDTSLDWLRAGEALSAAWLTATARGVSVLPLSATVEVAATRAVLRRMLSGLGEPCLVLRLGVPDPDRPGSPHTPRLAREHTIDPT